MMEVEYPDILSEYVSARDRLETNGLQFVCQMDPHTVAPGEVTALLLYLQNALDVPLQVTVRVHIPSAKEMRRGRSGPLPPLVNFTLFEPEMTLAMEAAEMGLLRIPLQIDPSTEQGEYGIRCSLAVTSQERGTRIRPLESQGRLGQTILKDTVGLGLAAAVGVGYISVPADQVTSTITVAGAAEQPAEVNLEPTFTSLWMPDELTIQQQALREINDRRIHILEQLKAEPMYVALLEESETAFNLASVALHVGERIFLARILTYTVQYFLENANRQDALLIPIWADALRNNLDTNDYLAMVTQVGYERVLRLAIALSFALVSETLQREPWTAEEQRAVADLVLDCIRQGEPLPIEFLYLPLLLGSLVIARKVTMPEENIGHSLQLLAQAKSKRAESFDEELQELNRIFDTLLTAAQQG
ncbi:MAG: hypothetical protein NUW24_12895 [Anaerolineae bacterium]|jgi:hypothetical protein|nr:hypothetical protein [Anaerolineae bacterium]MDH7474392.1 hypothetical protein [Anaerolineae bacterium]